MRLKTMWQRLLTVTTADDDIRRRGRHLILISVALIISTLPLFGISVRNRGLTPTNEAMLVLGALCVGIVILARRGRVTLGGALLTAVLIPPVLISLHDVGFNTVVPLFLTLPVLVAGLVLPPRAIGVVLPVLIVGGLVFGNKTDQIAIPSALIGLTIVALLAYLGASSIRTALKEAGAARDRAEQAAGRLAQANAELEQQVQERTQSLQQLLAESEHRRETQARLLEEIAVQRSLIRDLEVPVLPVTEKALVIPLVGALDDARLETVRTRALGAIESYRARRLLLDITGVPVVDTAVAQGLMAVVQAARLLGSEVVLIGVRPEVAQTIVGLGLDMSLLHTMRDLQTSIRELRIEN
jgi:rsbT co-antagonist protein RsbR